VSRAPAIGLALLVAAARAAHGVDGVIEINQARALAGGVSPGDTAGFPVLLSVPGSYRLTGDLDVRGETTPENVTAIRIAAHDVTLDLNGFGVVGPVVCTGGPPPTSCVPVGTGFGIDGRSFTNTRVTNGSVRGFRYGVWTGFATLDRVQAIGNQEWGITIQGSATFGGFPQGGGRITDCLAARNGGTGFMGLTEASGLRIESSRAFENAGHGFQLPIRSEIRSSEAIHNGGDGIFAPSGITLGNLSRDNLGAQLSGDGACGSNVLIAATAPTACYGQFEPNLCNGVLCATE
jgi:hypothetical protein